MGLIPGVVVLNGLLAGVGYCLLYPALRGRSRLVYASYGGVALLVGAGLVGVGLSVLAPLGIRIGVGAFAAVAAVLAAGGIATGFLPHRVRLRVDAGPRSEGRPSRASDIVITVAGFVIVTVLVIALIGGFRSAPWLDDTWYFWLPKGRALDLVGLDPRLWAPEPSLHMVFGSDYETLTFIRPDNPLWWSVLLNLDVRAVGSVDMRAVDGQLAFLLVGFVGATIRLLWGHVRAWILLPALLVLVSAPEFLRQAQGGDCRREPEKGAVIRRRLQIGVVRVRGVHDLSASEAEGVAEISLEPASAGLRQAFELIRSRAGADESPQAEVHTSLAVREGGFGFQHSAGVDTRNRVGHVDHGGDAAGGRRQRQGAEVFLLRKPRVATVNVHVDGAWEHVHPDRLHDARAGRVPGVVLLERSDDAVGDVNIDLPRTIGSAGGPPRDDELSQRMEVPPKALIKL